MKAKARQEFLTRLDSLVQSGVKKITISSQQRSFLGALVVEGKYRGVEIEVRDGPPAPAKVTRQT